MYYKKEIDGNWLREKIRSLPPLIYQLLLKIGELGELLNTNVYIVGGFVRDIFLDAIKSNNVDIDIVVEGDGILFAKILAERLCGRIRIYPEFLTAIIIYSVDHNIELCIDIATARSEYYHSPGALPVVEPTSIEKDLFRRDFTINSMALQLNKNLFSNFLDLFGGQKDIQHSTICVLHKLSFIDDPTRTIRAVRFEQRYHFKISKNNEKLIKEVCSLELMNKVSRKRLTHEFLLIFKEPSPSDCLLRMNELGILAAINKKFALTPKGKIYISQIKDVLDWYNLLDVNEISLDVKSIYLLILVRSYTYIEAEQVFKCIGIPKDFQDSLLNLKRISQIKCKELLLFFYKSKYNGFLNSKLYLLLIPIPVVVVVYFIVCVCNKKITDNLRLFIHTLRFVKPDVTGNDLKIIGIHPGPQYKQIFQDILQKKLDGKLQTKNEQLTYIYSNYVNRD